MYNTVWSEQPCPFCKQPLQVGVQIKYGWLKLDDYRIGEKLEWGQPGKHLNGGEPGRAKVVADGWAGIHTCPHCHVGDWPEPHDWFNVFLEHDVITAVRPSPDNDPYFGHEYVIIEE